MAPNKEDMSEEEALDKLMDMLSKMSPNEMNRVAATILADEIHNSADPDATRREIFHDLAKDYANGESLPDGSTSAICTRCGKRARYRACAKCKSVTYCSVDCQKADWKSHKPFCSSDYDGAEGIEKKTLLLAERLLRHSDLHGNLMQLVCHELGILQQFNKSKTHCARVLWDLVPVDSKQESKDRLMLTIKGVTPVLRSDLSAAEASKLATTQLAFEKNKKEEFRVHRPGERWPPPNLIGIVPVFFYSARTAFTPEPRSFIHFFPIIPELLFQIADQENMLLKAGLPSLDDEKMKSMIINDSIRLDVKNVYKLRWRPGSNTKDANEDVD